MTSTMRRTTAVEARSAARDAYIWRRQFSFDQLEKIVRVRRLRQRLLESTIEASAFARCQLQDSDRRYNVSHSFDGVWQGRNVYFEPQLRPLFMDYAIAVYEQAVSDALKYYPHFTRHVIHDGPLVGERRLVFPDQLDEAAAYWIRSRFYELAEKGKIRVAESFRAKHVKKSAIVGGRTKVAIDAALHRERTDQSTWEETKSVVAKGQPFPVDRRPRRCDLRLCCEMLAEMSLPELVVLNWGKVKRPMTKADQRLFDAIDNFDYDAAKQALAAGADPNALNEDDYTPLQAVVEFRWADRAARPPLSEDEWRRAIRELGPQPKEVIRFIDLIVNAGAAINWASFDESTPLAQACLTSDADVITHLLDLGADPSIRCYYDDHAGEWGGAWEYADFRCNPVVDNDDETAWKALVAKWPAPFGKVSMR